MFSHWSTRYGEWSAYNCEQQSPTREAGKLLAKRAMKLITRKARIITRDGEWWIAARAECSFFSKYRLISWF